MGDFLLILSLGIGAREGILTIERVATLEECRALAGEIKAQHEGWLLTIDARCRAVIPLSNSNKEIRP